MPARPKEETEFDEMLSMLDPEDMDELAGSYTWMFFNRGPGIRPRKNGDVFLPIIKCPKLVSKTFCRQLRIVTIMYKECKSENGLHKIFLCLRAISPPPPKFSVQ